MQPVPGQYPPLQSHTHTGLGAWGSFRSQIQIQRSRAFRLRGVVMRIRVQDAHFDILDGKQQSECHAITEPETA